MTDRHTRIKTVLKAVLLALLGATAAQGQELRQASTQGTVVDQLHVPVAEAEVFVRDSTQHLVATARTDSDGTFVLHGLDYNRRYLFGVRKIGLHPASEALWTPPKDAGDTLWVDFVLGGTVASMTPVRITDRIEHQNLFTRVDRLFERVNNVLAAFDRILDKACGDWNAPGFHLCFSTTPRQPLSPNPFPWPTLLPQPVPTMVVPQPGHN